MSSLGYTVFVLKTTVVTQLDSYINKSHIRKKPNDLLNSVFFNFTSIVYDYNSEKFIYDLNFLNFLQSRKIEIVNEENPDAELCFVNIYHNFKLFVLV